MALWGILGFIGFIILAILKDKTTLKDKTIIDEQLIKCEYCNKISRLNDYRNDLDHIYCTKCKTELKRSMSYWGIYTKN